MIEDFFDDYTVHLAEDEEGDFLAYFYEMPTVSAFGESAIMALEELKTAWLGVKESYKKQDKPVPVSPSQKEQGKGFISGLIK